MVRETHLSVHQLIMPLFIRGGEGVKNPIPSMPGHYQWSPDRLGEEMDELVSLGIQSVILFGIPTHKDERGSASWEETGVVQQAIGFIKKRAPHLYVIADVCLCEYTTHGHCGVLAPLGETSGAPLDVDNDGTLRLLAHQAISYAHAGADMVAPSGMMDGMVQTIRRALDGASFSHLPILSYAVKYASALYGPFRQAAEGAPQFGNRHSYQMDMGNGAQALREAELDVAEGADLLMVKPAHTYLDIIYRVKEAYPAIPLVAYHTSGEFAFLKAGAKAGALVEKEATLEVLTAIRRAGADLIITYYGKEAALWLQSSENLLAK
jgi:porphobilinogen synthase